MKSTKHFSRIHTSLTFYGAQIIIILILTNIITYISIRYISKAQSCMTKDQIVASDRCLYIFENSVYEKGEKNNPHKGHPCGMDVTSIIPESHNLLISIYLEPNKISQVCSEQPPTPTDTPTPTSTPSPTSTNTPAPTLTPVPTPSIVPTSTTRPTQTPTIPPTPTSSPTIFLSPTPSLTMAIATIPVLTNKPTPTAIPTLSLTPSLYPILSLTPSTYIVGGKVNTPTPILCPITGDADCSGTIDQKDITYVQQHIGSSDTQADLDDSGFVNTRDLTIMKQYISLQNIVSPPVTLTPSIPSPKISLTISAQPEKKVQDTTVIISKAIAIGAIALVLLAISIPVYRLIRSVFKTTRV